MLYQSTIYPITTVLTPPDGYDFLTLADMRTLLGINPTDTSNDARLSLIITEMSKSIAKLVNRVLAFQQVNETFYEMSNQRRLYLSQWPVKFDDIESMTLNGNDILTPSNGNGWVLEEETGTLYWPGGAWNGTLEVIYSGGYICPDDVPEDLRNVAAVMVREAYYTYLRGFLATGVRMLSHKHARIQFMQPTMGQGSIGAAGVSPQTMASVQGILDHYYRHWI